MIVEGRVLDQILRELYPILRDSTDTFSASKGEGRDLLGAKVLLRDPRGRISATATRGRLISALGEFCWYLSGSADLEFMRYYVPSYPPKGVFGEVEEAYGPRLVGQASNQIERVIERLRDKPDTRRAVIVLLRSSDLVASKNEAPCTVALQFIRRRERLHLVAMMRSNDAYMGFIHDVFCFTLIQELVARALGIRIGEYHHFATSLHLYDSDLKSIGGYLGEGFQNPTFAMPKMPPGDQRTNLKAFLEVERAIREGAIEDQAQITLVPYWKDLALVLLRFADGKFGRGSKVKKRNFSAITSSFYQNFFLPKPRVLGQKAGVVVKQEEMDLGEE